MLKEIKIGNTLIGANHPCFIIVEAGVNHNGNIKTALKMIDKAKEIGASAIKFQTFKAEQLAKKDAPKAAYQNLQTKKSETQFEI